MDDRRHSRQGGSKMIVINQVKTELVLDNNYQKRITEADLIDNKEILYKKTARILGVHISEIEDIKIMKHSIDARKKPQLFQVYTLGVVLCDTKKEAAIVRRNKNSTVTLDEQKSYVFPAVYNKKCMDRPVVIGMGPAGLLCGYMLAKHGYRPILLERGYDVDTRTKDVEAFWNGAKLNLESNVQFGEGGAGTFSDGKLNTLVKDKMGRNREVLRIFVECGAPEQILYESKPHIGTDVLKTVVINIRKFILQNGGTVCFGSKVTGFIVKDKRLQGVIVNNADTIYTTQAVLAIGHSARDTFAYLNQIHISMEAKAFAIGLRVEHPQQLINENMYGDRYGNMLPAASYKLTAQTSTGRGVYSFCMCPGGYVVNASSESGKLAINGMSYFDRDSSHANSAIIVQVTPQDYMDSSPLAGVEFQRDLEKKAYQLGKGAVPVQYYGDFLKNCSFEEEKGSVKRELPCIKGRYTFANLRGLLPEECEKAFIEAMEQFDRKIHGYAAENVLLSGIESRTSSAVRIHRGEDLQSPSMIGLYPCGEGAGYAGGITSAAMDGILVAERVALNLLL